MKQLDWAVETRGLTVRYGEFTAADSVSIQAGPGEILGLLGPNGAGKTSVIRALTTIVPVSGGTANVNGHDLSDPVAVRSSIGVLPESNGYPGAQSALSYLRFYGELFGLPRSVATARAERRLAELGLGGNDQRISSFSRGMRQRLGLARALINGPAVLFLDEPTLGLDPAGQEELLAHLARVAIDDGTCVVLCSHQLDDVERVCDRVAIMHRARIVAAGTVDEVVRASGVPEYCRIRLAPDDVPAASRLLKASPAVRSWSFDNSRPGDMDLQVVPNDSARREVLSLLLEAGIAPRTLDFQGSRLTDAFRALTSDGGSAA
jgi:ABC-2 type transport system ATP-binding protein